MQLYKTTPIDTISGIPVFCTYTKYIANYDEIAQTHMRYVEKGIPNPWDPTDFIQLQTAEFFVYINGYYKLQYNTLDAGIGLGELYDHFECPNKYGVDISLDYLKIVKNKGINVCKAILEDLPYTSEYFDMIFCKNVLEHVLNLHAVISEFYRILKPGGYLIIQTPYNQNLKEYATTYKEYDYVHLRSFDEWNLILLFEKIFNFKVLNYRIATYKPSIDIITMIIQKN